MFLCFCDGVVVFLWLCFCVFVMVSWCFRAGVVVFLWLCCCGRGFVFL